MDRAEHWKPVKAGYWNMASLMMMHLQLALRVVEQSA